MSVVAAEFRPEQLTLAREKRGLTKAQLAEVCGVSRRAVSDWEAGRVATPPLGVLAAALNFDEEFFTLEIEDRVQPEHASFRALSSLSARDLKATLATATVVGVFSKWIDEHFDTPEIDVPWLDQLVGPIQSRALTPSESAEALRRLWSMGSAPVGDMMALLETKGVRVFSLAGDIREVDAFSLWLSGRPAIFLNVNKSAERLRFDLAHELGHLVMHRDVVTAGDRASELSANEFAGSFLVPRESLMSRVTGRLSLPDVLLLKKSYGVSATAMVVRLHQLYLINDWQYRNWMVELSKRGYRKNEPDGISKERSTLLTEILRMCRKDGLSLRQIAGSLKVPGADLAEAVDGLTLIGVP
ncbi:XRE family transcriptional regulator [Nigerium massiliense]|uniref:XRE family transcriptional regulator n=1 Tax=Nigerium massiliense TaxID=1522317 RepID=UPI000907D5E0|nr:XRE family transcriptional regulator [Nigerium massiliense]